MISLFYAIFKAWTGLRSGRVFTASDNRLRHITATILHIQMLVGLSLYMISPIVKYATGDTGNLFSDHTFFQWIHISLMAIAVVFVTIGSAKAKRAATDSLKFRTMLIWFAVTLVIILIAIPWPFSPLASRPYFRPF